VDVESLTSVYENTLSSVMNVITNRTIPDQLTQNVVRGVTLPVFVLAHLYIGAEGGI